MKTVSELAKELDVSNKTIYRHLDKVRRNVEHGVTVTNGGITYITELGEEKIKESVTGVRLFREKPNNVKDSPTAGNVTKDDEEIQYLRKLVTDLQSELKTEREHSRQQVDRIADLAEQIADLTRNQQVLFSVEQQKSLPLVIDDDTMEDSESGKKGFFKKIFGKK